MARKPVALSVAELEQLLSRARKEVRQLQERRGGLVKEIEQVDSRLAELGVRKRGRPVKRAKSVGPKPGRPVDGTKAVAEKKAGKKKPGRKKMTLAEHITEILKASSQPMSPLDICKELRARRASKSKNLGVQVSQILASDRVSVKKVGRGQYLAAQ